MHTAAQVLGAIVGAHILLKFAFFALPYRRRRADLDRAYGTALSATKRSDIALRIIVVALVVVLFVAGVHPPSFLIGLWCGATLIQLYFHEYHDPLPADMAPQTPAGPIKTMSYAIQAAPWKPWRELLLLTAVVVAGVVALIA